MKCGVLSSAEESRKALIVPYLHDHLHGGQGGGDVLRVGGSHGDGNTASVQAAVEGCNQVDACRRDSDWSDILNLSRYC